MACYYFDTSALVKRSHAEEGTAVVDRLFTEADSIVVISRLGIVETVSALAMRVRTGELPLADFSLVRKRFLGEVSHGSLKVFRLLVGHFESAERLIERHAPTRRLRTLDALQLAVALDLYKQRRIDMFVSADRTLCEIATLESVPALDPLSAL